MQNGPPCVKTVLLILVGLDACLYLILQTYICVGVGWCIYKHKHRKAYIASKKKHTETKAAGHYFPGTEKGKVELQ